MMRRPGHVVVLLLAVATVITLIPFARRDDGDRLRFVVWGMPFEDRLFRDGYAHDFEAAHPGLRVDYERYPSVIEKYLAWHLLGQGADVMRVGIDHYPTLVARGALAPIDAFLDDPELGLDANERGDFVPAIWDALEIGGHRYALPADNAQYGLYYNPALFHAWNAAHPDDPLELPGPGWTWEHLREVARKLTVRDEAGRIVQYGVDFDLWPWPFMAFFAQAGGELWNEDGTRTGIDSPAGAEALDLIVELLPHAGTLRGGDLRDSASGPDKLFAEGRTAVLLDGSWRAPALELLAPDLDFAIAPLPRHRRAAIVTGSVLWAISAHSPRKREAWAMIRWMTGPEQSLRYWDALRVAPPARVSVVRSPAFRVTHGLVDADGSRRTPAMGPGQFDARARWLFAALDPDPVTGLTPGFVAVAPYQKELEEQINALLGRAVSPSRRESSGDLVRAAADAVHRAIDRSRQ
jgi:ABC-type glycerol-3-phosphate transport system substrate-binding protein